MNKISFKNWRKITDSLLSRAGFAVFLIVTFLSIFFLQWLFAADQLVAVVQNIPEQTFSYVVEGTLNFYKFPRHTTPLLIILTGLIIGLYAASARETKLAKGLAEIAMWTVGMYVIVAWFESTAITNASFNSGTGKETVFIRYVFLAFISLTALRKAFNEVSR